MTDFFAQVDGVLATKLEIHVPGNGVWYVDADLADTLPVTGAKSTVKIGGTFSAAGTIDQNHDGAFADTRRTRVLAGGGGWGSLVPAKAYRNDAGVSAQIIAADAASAAGEVLADFTGNQVTLGAKYVRASSTASRVLEDAARGASWWVDFAGVTHVGPRPVPPAPAPGSVTLLDFDARLNIATLIVDDLTQIGIGTVITDERLTDGPITIAAYEIRVTAETMRVVAWCGSEQESNLADTLRAIVKQVHPTLLSCKYRYRVQTLELNRVNLQAVSQAPGLPDLLSVSFAQGVAGVFSKLALGATCYVEFIAGDHADPVITGFCARGEPGYLPQGITIGANDETAPLAARQGDGVTSLFPPMVIAGTIIQGGVPSPFTGVATIPTGQILGTITGGSAANVKIG